ncbi:MAG: hypothetical protein AAF638_08035 [Pseudomonadota bacterium]
MATYRAILLFPEGGEGRYEFEAPEAFIENPPARVVDTFLSTVEGLDLPAPAVDSEINAAHNFRDIRCVTASGSIQLRTGSVVPFVAMISEARA